jgi:hypothetical protein
MWTRKIGSRRASRSQPIEFQTNWGGQGGSSQLTIKTAEGWLVIEPESQEDVRQLMSQAAILHCNYREKRA